MRGISSWDQNVQPIIPAFLSGKGVKTNSLQPVFFYVVVDKPETIFYNKTDVFNFACGM